MLKMINNYYVNPDNIAYLEHCLMEGAGNKGTRIVFNAYAAAASEGQHGWEALSVEILGSAPTQVADFLNGETLF